MKNKSLLMTFAIMMIALYSFAQETGTLTDSRDGKTYKTMKIGTQTWMAVSLAYKTESGCWAYDNSQNNVANFGYLYNWETAKKVCPTDWRLPSEEDWKTMTTTLRSERENGGNTREQNSRQQPRGHGGQTSMGGYRSDDGTFHSMEEQGFWWTSNEIGSSSKASFRARGKGPNGAIKTDEGMDKSSGLSVRCVKD